MLKLLMIVLLLKLVLASSEVSKVSLCVDSRCWFGVSERATERLRVCMLEAKGMNVGCRDYMVSGTFIESVHNLLPSDVISKVKRHGILPRKVDWLSNCTSRSRIYTLLPGISLSRLSVSSESNCIFPFDLNLMNFLEENRDYIVKNCSAKDALDCVSYGVRYERREFNSSDCRESTYKMSSEENVTCLVNYEMLLCSSVLNSCIFPWGAYMGLDGESGQRACMYVNERGKLGVPPEPVCGRLKEVAHVNVKSRDSGILSELENLFSSVTGFYREVCGVISSFVKGPFCDSRSEIPCEVFWAIFGVLCVWILISVVVSVIVFVNAKRHRYIIVSKG